MGTLVVAAQGCREDRSAERAGEPPAMVTLTFQIELNRQVYQDSAWGDPPQLAIWIENQVDRSVRTVMVTHRTARCDWDGKVECSVALPYWVGFYNRQTGTQGPPTWQNPAPDAMTCATPKAGLTAAIVVPAGARWTYFIEVNVSGDFNMDFRRLSDEGRPDLYGNGQPSLIYRGTIEAVEGAVSRPVPIGHTDQYEPSGRIIEDMNGILTAAELLQSIGVSCRAVSQP
jgi:hypothetical protein